MKFIEKYLNNLMVLSHYTSSKFQNFNKVYKPDNQFFYKNKQSINNIAMSRLIFCVFLLCSKMLFSQIETKETFLNQVYKNFIPEDYRYFYVETPYIPDFFDKRF